MLIALGALVPAPVARHPEAQPERSRIVILGGGFAGVSAARRLESLAPRGPRWDVTLVSRSNYLLFTPMLAEVASGAIEAQHIAAPVRAACPQTRFLRGEALRVDLARRCVHVQVGQREREVPYDHLVLAMGAEPTYRDLPGLAENALTLKSLADATAVRNHVIAQLEAAEGEQDAAERRRLLTFVVVGGGFAGTELLAELRDLVARVARFFPDVRGEAMRYLLVHSRERILPEVSPSLAAFALRQLRERGIEFRLGVRVAGLTERALQLEGGESIDAGTVVWTAGNQASPVVQALPFEKGPTGAVKVDASFRVPGVEGVWAIGDCAAIPAEGDSLHPPTAQHALREGKSVADGISVQLRGGRPHPFRFQSIGTLVALGHRTAVAELRGARFTGFLAWLMWRAVYLGKLPGLEKKVRVLSDWVVDLIFPRDIVLNETPKRPERKAEVPEEAAP
jgi:NADH dehydrogenase